jgi:hypothetical protein
VLSDSLWPLNSEGRRAQRSYRIDTKSLWWKYRWMAGNAMLTIVESRNARKAPKAATSSTDVDDGCRRLASGVGRPPSRWRRLPA